MRFQFATLPALCAACAALVALSAGVQAATHSKPGMNKTVKARVHISKAELPAAPIAPWPPVRASIGPPILPTQYPNVYVRYQYGPAVGPSNNASIFKGPGAAEPVRGMVPLAVQKPFQPVVGDLPGGGKFALSDPADMDYMVATRDASGHMVVTCVKPYQAASPKEGGAK